VLPRALPTLWLLGKRNSGKSTLVQTLTGDSRAAIGNGYEACTQTAQAYEHPIGQPVLRFLDTRGLGDPNYDPAADLAFCEGQSHAILLLIRTDDPDTSALREALELLEPVSRRQPFLIVHTARSDGDLERSERGRAFNQQAMEQCIGRPIPSVLLCVDQPEQARSLIVGAIIDLVPEMALVLGRGQAETEEQQKFLELRSIVVRYASAASGADLMPALGLVAVPVIQGQMLRTLAAAYELEWDTGAAVSFLATLGSSFLYRYLLALVGRQLGKLVPFAGQTAGALAAASISFASTYALGRTACLYCYHKSRNDEIDSSALQAAFRAAMQGREPGADRGEDV
jgi:uncharacterized protein (DUF697 family)